MPLHMARNVNFTSHQFGNVGWLVGWLGVQTQRVVPEDKCLVVLQLHSNSTRCKSRWVVLHTEWRGCNEPGAEPVQGGLQAASVHKPRNAWH